MIRDIINIDEDKCTGCGICIPNCHEGALQIIDGKARLISDLMCDGLGACIGHCPEDAITLEKRESKPYNEKLVMSDMLQKGKNTIIAHLKHMKDYKEFGFLTEGIEYLIENREKADFDIDDVIEVINSYNPEDSYKEAKEKTTDKVNPESAKKMQGGCPGSRTMTIDRDKIPVNTSTEGSTASELRQWPVQMHLINPNAGYFQKSNLLIAADCVAYAAGDFHSRHLKGKTLAIACPKLDSNMDIYVEKIKSLIDDAEINTITVLMMEVPCCGGLLRLVKAGTQKASRKVPVKLIIAGIDGSVQKEEWV